MSIPLPLTKSQLAEVVQCYATAFPEWKVIDGNRFVRAHGPLIQQIGFEALRSGAYRPMAGIRALPLPSVRMLPQLLDVKHRQLLLREHAARWNGVVTAMELQFRPPVRKPLDLWEIKTLCENAAKESTNDLCMLAILNAYLGEGEKALAYCHRMQILPPPSLAPRVDWEHRHKEFGRELSEAIKDGDERRFLDTAAATAPELT